MVSINVIDEKQVIIKIDKELKQKHFDEILKIKILEEPIRTTVTIDLSEINWIELDAALWFISYLNRLKTCENDIRIIFPDPEKHSGKLIWAYLNTWKFFNALKECVDSPVNLLDIDQLKYIHPTESFYKPIPPESRKTIDDRGEEHVLPYNLLEIESIKSGNYWNDILKYITNFKGIAWVTIRNYCGWTDNETTQFVDAVVKEGLMNSFIHGKNSFTNVAMKTDSKNVILVICDNGKGIPTSLRETFNNKKELLNGKDYSKEEDAFLLTYFTKPEMVIDSLLIDQATHKAQGAIGRNGNGLYYLKDFILRHNGRLRIRSGRAWVGFENFKNEEKIDPVDYLVQSPGTLITIILPKIR